VKGNCLQSSVLCKASVTTTDNKQTRTYIGVTGDNFKLGTETTGNPQQQKILKRSRAIKTLLETKRQQAQKHISMAHHQAISITQFPVVKL
jgi:hypothetical protein